VSTAVKVAGFIIAATLTYNMNLNKEVVVPKDEENFFLSPVFGDLANSVPVKWIGKSSNIPPDSYAKTFIKTVYLKGGRFTDTTSANSKVLNSDFKKYITMLIHEMKHIQQFKACNFRIELFGRDFLFEDCRAKVLQVENSMEVEAINTAETINPLLTSFVRFWKVWKLSNLKPTIGFPTSASPVVLPVTPAQTEAITELSFSKGIIQFKSDMSCYRVLSGEIMNKKKAADCEIIRPIDPASERCKIANPPVGCNKAQRDLRNNECRVSRADFKAALDKLIFDCTTFSK